MKGLAGELIPARPFGFKDVFYQLVLNK